MLPVIFDYKLYEVLFDIETRLLSKFNPHITYIQSSRVFDNSSISTTVEFRAINQNCDEYSGEITVNCTNGGYATKLISKISVLGENSPITKTTDYFDAHRNGINAEIARLDRSVEIAIDSMYNDVYRISPNNGISITLQLPDSMIVPVATV